MMSNFKSLILTSCLVMSVAHADRIKLTKEITKGSMTDARDHQKYETITVSGMTWMAENLNYALSGSYCYNNDPKQCQYYGRLYTWNLALQACPTGWHLPSDGEWQTLNSALSGKGLADASWYGDASSGFNALPAGFRYEDGSFYLLGSYAYFWSSTENGESNAWYRFLNKGDAEFVRYDNYRSYAFSVRCLQD